MAKSSRKTSRRSRKTRRGGAWYDPRTWFGQKTEEVAPTGTPVSQMTDGVETPSSTTGTSSATGTIGGKHRGRRHRKTKRSH